MNELPMDSLQRRRKVRLLSSALAHPPSSAPSLARLRPPAPSSCGALRVASRSPLMHLPHPPSSPNPNPNPQALDKLWNNTKTKSHLGLIPQTKKQLQEAKRCFEDADQQRRNAIYTPHIGNIVLATLRCLKTELDAAASANGATLVASLSLGCASPLTGRSAPAQRPAAQPPTLFATRARTHAPPPPPHTHTHARAPPSFRRRRKRHGRRHAARQSEAGPHVLASHRRPCRPRDGAEDRRADRHVLAEREISRARAQCRRCDLEFINGYLLFIRALQYARVRGPTRKVPSSTTQ